MNPLSDFFDMTWKERVSGGKRGGVIIFGNAEDIGMLGEKFNMTREFMDDQ